MRVAAVLLVSLALAAPAAAAGGPVTGRVTRTGAWLTDPQGRALVFHGVNVLKKVAPFVRTGFGEPDARLLADEGFTVARIGFIWEGAEPQPGVYDDAYIDRVLALDDLLARYGIRTLVDFHQDVWGRSTNGDGAPAWATLGSGADASFAAFWRDDMGPGGVGIQTRFVDLWHHVAERLSSHANIIGLDPFNEPYPGSDYPPPCGDFTPCPQFEAGALADFTRRVTTAIRAGGARQVIFPEGVATSGSGTPGLPRFPDPQTAYQFHYYCNLTQLDPRSVAVGDSAPEADACLPIEQRNLGVFHDYARGVGVPAILGEFSCNDVNPDNAQVVDIGGAAFDSWTIWAYYTAADDPADCPGQGLVADDGKPGSQENVKQLKLDAIAVPHAQAVAGTPIATTLDRSTRTFTLDYAAAGVTTLSRHALTQIFVPARAYPAGYAAAVTGGTVVSRPGAPWLLVRTAPGAGKVRVTVTPATGTTTRRPLASGALPLDCASLRLPRGARVLRVLVAGRRVTATRHGRRLVVRVPGRAAVRVVLRTRGGKVVRLSARRTGCGPSRPRR